MRAAPFLRSPDERSLQQRSFSSPAAGKHDSPSWQQLHLLSPCLDRPSFPAHPFPPCTDLHPIKHVSTVGTQAEQTPFRASRGGEGGRRIRRARRFRLPVKSNREPSNAGVFLAFVPPGGATGRLAGRQTYLQIQNRCRTVRPASPVRTRGPGWAARPRQLVPTPGCCLGQGVGTKRTWLPPARRAGVYAAARGNPAHAALAGRGEPASREGGTCDAARPPSPPGPAGPGPGPPPPRSGSGPRQRRSPRAGRGQGPPGAASAAPPPRASPAGGPGGARRGRQGARGGAGPGGERDGDVCVTSRGARRCRARQAPPRPRAPARQLPRAGVWAAQRGRRSGPPPPTSPAPNAVLLVSDPSFPVPNTSLT